MYDAIVIGGGPGGVSAALYIKRGNLNVAIIDSGKSSLEKASKIDNYYGFSQGIRGKELYQNGINQAKNLGVEIINEEIVAIENLGSKYLVKTSNGEYETKKVVIATGSSKTSINIKGVKEYEGSGVSYCAICDAFFYRKKKVAILGAGKFAVSEADILSNVASEIIILTNGEKLDNIKYKVCTGKVVSVNGDEVVRSVTLDDGSTLEIDGLFIALGEAGASDFAKTLGIKLDQNHIVVDENMETNLKGIYAVGDATKGLKQVAKAVYDGAVAGLAICKSIREERK